MILFLITLRSWAKTDFSLPQDLWNVKEDILDFNTFETFLHSDSISNFTFSDAMIKLFKFP